MCELAHDTIELALNSVIVAAGGKYRSTHDLSMLTKAAAAANEPLPRELDGVRQLPRYTGGGRYSFRRPGGQEPISRASYEHILNLAEKTSGWAKDRLRTLTGEEIDGNGEAEKRKEELEPLGGRKPVVEGDYPADPRLRVSNQGPPSAESTVKSGSNRSAGTEGSMRDLGGRFAHRRFLTLSSTIFDTSSRRRVSTAAVCGSTVW